MIEYLPAEILQGDLLERLVYPNLERTLYWSNHWDPDFYVGLVHAGFICIATEHEELGSLLVPEMQDAYAVLDWPALHISRNLRRVIRSDRLEREDVVLHIEDPRIEVLPRIHARYGSDCWLIDAYMDLIDVLLDEDDRVDASLEHFALHGIALRSRASGELIAGEFGYSTGSRYTSLSGFCSSETRAWRHFGTLQQVWLARVLETNGYAFWNLGHAQMPYKHALGARPLPRSEFLDRWLGVRGEMPACPLALGQTWELETLLRTAADTAG